MAYSAKGSPYGTTTIEVGKTYDYDYPHGLDLRPGSKLHQMIIAKVVQQSQDAHDSMKSRYPIWEKIDNNLTSYVMLDEAEKALNKQDPRRPVSIVIPMSFAILETILTYYMDVFFDTMFDTLEGIGPEDTLGAILLRHDLKAQFMRGDGELSLYTQLRDATVYGIGAMSPMWYKEMGLKQTSKPTGFSGALGRFFQTGVQQDFEETILWEGHRFENIDPYRIMPDPNTPIQRFQDGESFGWLESTNRMALLDREKSGEDLFNCRYLGEAPGQSAFSLDESGRRSRDSRSPNEVPSSNTHPVDVLNRYVNFIPKEWGIDLPDRSGEYPEKWLFKVANDKVIIGAQPLGLKHNSFPVTVCAPEFDGYTVSPLSRIESIFGLQGVTDWMINSHIANVRKTINNHWLCDPGLINMKDVYDRSGQAGGVIRMRQDKWGGGVKDGIMQLPTTDVTRNHPSDVNYLISIMERVGGASGAMQGVLQENAPERRTATEFSGTQKGAQGRMKSKARLIYAMTIRKMIDLMASQTQQLRANEDFVRINGDWSQRLSTEYGLNLQDGRIKVSPSDLDIRYDIGMIDGSLPASEDGNLMLQLFQLASSNPELIQRLDIPRMYMSLARRFGEKNIENFLRQGGQFNVVPMQDESIQQGNFSSAGEVV